MTARALTLALALNAGCHLLIGHAPPGLELGVSPDRAWLDLRLDGPALAETAPPDSRGTDRAGDASTSTCPGDPALVACYRFESGVLAKDESPTKNDLSTVSSASSVQGVEGGAVKLGQASRLKAPDHPALLPGALTTEVWVSVDAYPPAAQGRAGVFDKNTAYGLFVKPTGLISCKIVEVEAEAPIALKTWVHAACTWDGATVTLVLDGVAKTSNSKSGPLGADGSPLVIGGDSPSEGERFEGLLDNLRIWSTVRSSSQICAAVKRGGKSCP